MVILLDIVCENCGSKNLKEINGIVTCNACGTKYPNISLSNVGIDEELKEQEIRRLVRENNKIFSLNREPKLGLLTDEEILRYAPHSRAAESIRTKNAKSIIEKIKVNRTYRSYVTLAIIFGFMILIFIVIFLFTR